jgi:hypothetical protein
VPLCWDAYQGTVSLQHEPALLDRALQAGRHCLTLVRHRRIDQLDECGLGAMAYAI